MKPMRVSTWEPPGTPARPMRASLKLDDEGPPLPHIAIEKGFILVFELPSSVEYSHGASLTTLFADGRRVTQRVILGPHIDVDIAEQGTGPVVGGGTLPTDPGGSLPMAGRIGTKGKVFIDSTGRDWKMKSATDFKLLKLFIDGVDIRPIVRQRKSAGANTVRVLGMGDWLGLNPAREPDFYERLVAFLALMDEEAVKVELVCFADAPKVMPNLADQQAHWKKVCAAVRGKLDFLELGNEVTHAANKLDILKFDLPADILTSRGSGLGGDYPAAPSGGYATTHTSRSNWIANMADALIQQRVIGVPVVNNEPMGAHEVAVPGRRSNNPMDFRKAGEIAGTGNGGCFHSEVGLHSEPWGPVTAACAREFFAGIDAAVRGEVPTPTLPPVNTFGQKPPRRALEITKRLYERHLDLAAGDDAKRRALTLKICEQLVYELGPSWGSKRASQSRPLSKDGYAQKQNDGKVFSWDWQNGDTRKPNAAPFFHDITKQVFVPVLPVNHLGL